MELFKEKRLEMNNYKSFIEIIEIDLLYPDLEFANPMLWTQRVASNAVVFSRKLGPRTEAVNALAFI